MSDRIKEWDEYFGIHCHLPAAAIRDLFDEIERLRAALADAHDVLANGGDLNTDTYQTRCNRALAITREALQEGES